MADPKDRGTVFIDQAPSAPFEKPIRTAATVAKGAAKPRSMGRKYAPLTSASQVGKRRYGRNLSVAPPKVKL